MGAPGPGTIHDHRVPAKQLVRASKTRALEPKGIFCIDLLEGESACSGLACGSTTRGDEHRTVARAGPHLRQSLSPCPGGGTIPDHLEELCPVLVCGRLRRRTSEARSLPWVAALTKEVKA